MQPGKRPGSAQRMRFLRQRFRQRLKTIVERAAGRGRAGEALPVGRLAMEPVMLFQTDGLEEASACSYIAHTENNNTYLEK